MSAVETAAADPGDRQRSLEALFFSVVFTGRSSGLFRLANYRHKHFVAQLGVELRQSNANLRRKTFGSDVAPLFLGCFASDNGLFG